MILEYNYLFAQIYAHYNDINNAKLYFGKAIEGATDIDMQIDILGKLAALVQESSNETELNQIVKNMRDITDSPQREEKLLSNISSLSKWYKDDILKIGILERRCFLRPADLNNRFNLAYLYSVNGFEDLAMFHYEKIPFRDRDGTTWNNLGVAYQHFSMPGKSVDAYKKAAEKDETLAMCNLSNLLMNSGFVNEAKEWIEKAESYSSYHNNIPKARVRLMSLDEDENNIRNEKLCGLKEKSEFFADAGENIWREIPIEFSGSMHDDKCVLELNVENGNFLATGSYKKEVPTKGLIGALTGAAKSEFWEVHEIEYRGKFVGRVVVGNKSEKVAKKSHQSKSLLNMTPIDTKFIFILQGGCCTIVSLGGV